MFTIEVKKREKDEDFTFKDLEMYHSECYGGKIIVYDDLLTLKCKRCNQSIHILEEEIIFLVKTAIDGKEREVKNNRCGYSFKIIQKTD
jgi:hypothetical protein